MRRNIMEHPWRQKMTLEVTIQNMTMISPPEISHNRINGLRYIVSSIFILVWSLFGHSRQKFIWPDQFRINNFIKLQWADLTLFRRSLFRYHNYEIFFTCGHVRLRHYCVMNLHMSNVEFVHFYIIIWESKWSLSSQEPF